MNIFEITKKPALQKEAIQYFWKCWGSDDNFKFYEDCMLHSINKDNQLPKFYIALENEQIIGSYALLTNDIISRQDIWPWFACLYVDEAHCKKGYAEMLLNHSLEQAKLMGFENVYLSTDLKNFYERKGWEVFGVGYNLFGEGFNIYTKSTK